LKLVLSTTRSSKVSRAANLFNAALKLGDLVTNAATSDLKLRLSGTPTADTSA
jgi:hypothetical protein